jgi:beta-glucosidase
MTHNEPWVYAWIGHSWGKHAPGRTNEADAVATAHHLLLSHGWAVEAIRSASPDAQVGIALNLAHTYPASDSPEDEAAAWRVDGAGNRWFLDPIFRGSYPADLLDRRELVAPFVLDGDMEAIAAPIDFLGVNFYQPAAVRPSSADGPLAVEQVPSDGPRTAMGWTVEPSALTALLLRLQRDYGEVPLVITENGASYDDPPLDGQAVIEDPQRVAFLSGHVEAVERAVESGADVRGYYVWSLLDNFEWEHGYDRRFGIVAVNFDNLKRTPKRSALWYRDLIARHSEGS